MPLQRSRLLVFLFSVLSISSYTQVDHESYRQQVEEAVSKREKADVFLQMTEEFVEDDPEQALQLATELVRLVEGQKSKQAQAHFLLGQAQYYLDQNEAAVQSFQKALIFAQKNNKNDLSLQANILSFWVSTYLFMANTPSPLRGAKKD